MQAINLYITEKLKIDKVAVNKSEETDINTATSLITHICNIKINDANSDIIKAIENWVRDNKVHDFFEDVTIYGDTKRQPGLKSRCNGKVKFVDSNQVYTYINKLTANNFAAANKEDERCGKIFIKDNILLYHFDYRSQNIWDLFIREIK